MIECFHILVASVDGNAVSVPVDTILRVYQGSGGKAVIRFRPQFASPDLATSSTVSAVNALIDTLRTDLMTAITG